MYCRNIIRFTIELKTCILTLVLLYLIFIGEKNETRAYWW